MSLKKDPKFDLSDTSLFGNEAAEDEADDIFRSIFVQRGEFRSFTNPNQQISIINGYKGEGKSALLRATQVQLSQKNDPPLIISTRSTDFQLGTPTSYDEWVRAWRGQLANHIAAQLGKTIGIAWRADDIAAVEAAERAGFKEKNFVGLLLERFKMSLAGLEPISEGKSTSIRPDELERIVSSREMWILLDDSDLNFKKTEQGIFRVAGLFTAARHLCNSIRTLRFRATVRPTTWSILYREVEDMTHVQQYILEMQWQVQDLRNVLARRIEAYLIRTNQEDTLPQIHNRVKREESIIELLFGEDWSWGLSDEWEPSRKRPHVVLGTLSRQRPRWLVELCREASSRADARDGSTITLQDVNQCLVSFGKKRLQNTISEFSVECGDIESILTSFERQPERYKTDELLKTITNKITSGIDVRIAGEIGRCNSKTVAQFLFRIGFLTARLDNKDGTYDHFSYAEKHFLLSDSSNLDHGHSWEIHPIFRQALSLQNVYGQHQRPKRSGGGRESR